MVFFRATSLHDALSLLQGMIGLRGAGAPRIGWQELLLLAGGLMLALVDPIRTQ